MNLIIFIFACWGATQILVYGEIFDRIRPDHKFFHCTMCVGFHVGWAIYLLFWSMGLWADQYQLQWAFLAGCVSSATSSALCALFTDLGLSISTGEGSARDIVQEANLMTLEDAKDQLKELEL